MGDAKNLIVLGDKAIEKDSITPSDYFNYVKGMKKEITDEYLQLIIDNGLKMLERTKLTKQTEMAKMITHRIETALKELAVVRKGYNLFISRKDLDKFIHGVEGKAIKIIELKNYSREIPDEVIDKLVDLKIFSTDEDGKEVEKDMFDEYYVVFTDYALKETKKVAKERREKDPILFGAFLDDTNKSDIYMEDRLYFIGDWVDEYCDLTLKEIVENIKESEDRDIVYRVDTPEDEEGIRNILSSYSQKPDDNNKHLKKYDTYIEDTPDKKKKNPIEVVKDVVKKATKKKSSKKKEDK